MSDLEKLAAIRARCVELLELASKRTPGEWYMSQNEHTVYGRHNRNARIAMADDGPADTAFIASCAGPAEAGWRATIAAIDALEAAHIALPELDNTAWDGLRSIIAAWEGQV